MDVSVSDDKVANTVAVAPSDPTIIMTDLQGTTDENNNAVHNHSDFARSQVTRSC
jgi:hypothetical protein